MNKPPITETRVTSKHSRSNRNAGYFKAVVYVDNCIGTDIVDEWFDKHDIRNLDYRCNSWNWLKRQLNELIVPIMLQHLGLDLQYTKMRWSDYAGCTCPCSKGFILEHIGTSMQKSTNFPSYQHLHMDVFLTITQQEQVRTFCAQATERLNIEKSKHELARIAAKSAMVIE